MTLLRNLLFAFAVLGAGIFGSSGEAEAAAYYTPAASITVMQGFGFASPTVRYVYVAGVGPFSWGAPCTPDNFNTYAATGVSSSVGCWYVTTLLEVPYVLDGSNVSTSLAGLTTANPAVVAGAVIRARQYNAVIVTGGGDFVVVHAARTPNACDHYALGTSGWYVDRISYQFGRPAVTDCGASPNGGGTGLRSNDAFNAACLNLHGAYVPLVNIAWTYQIDGSTGQSPVVCRGGQFIAGPATGSFSGVPLITSNDAGPVFTSGNTSGTAGAYDIPGAPVSNLKIEVAGAGSIGVLFDHTSNAHADNLQIDGADIAVKVRDSITFYSDGIRCGGGKRCVHGIEDDIFSLNGMYISRFDCESQSIQCIDFDNATDVIISGGINVQGVGTASSGLGAIAITNSGGATSTAGKITGVHFESNLISDLVMSGTGPQTTCIVEDNSFLSTPGVSNVAISNCTLTMMGNGGLGLFGFTPNVSLTSTVGGFVCANSPQMSFTSPNVSSAFFCGGSALTANTGSTNNSASGSGAYVVMTPNYTIPANALTSGRAMRVTVGFKFTTGSAVPVFHWQLRAGSTVIAQINPSAFLASQPGLSVSTVINIQALAAPGAAVNVETDAVASPGGLNIPLTGTNQIAQPVALATNGALTLQAATQWDTAGTGTNTVQIVSLTVEFLN